MDMLITLICLTFSLSMNQNITSFLTDKYSHYDHLLKTHDKFFSCALRFLILPGIIEYFSVIQTLDIPLLLTFFKYIFINSLRTT